MSGMNFLERLLDGVAVEWKPLGEALARTKGTKITAGQMKELHKEDAPLKIFAGGKTIAFVDFEDIPEKDINREPSIIVKSRGFIEFDYYDKPFSHKNEMWSYHSKDENINIKFVYYLLKINEPYFQNLGSKMQMPQIATPDTDKFQIPIPPLKIQAEIVRILDTFTALTAELTAELSDRKKQYNYYRNRLLTFEEGEVEWKTLGEIGKILRGTAITAKEANSGDYPVVGNAPSHNYFHDQSNRIGETIVIARSGVYAGLVSYWDIPIFLTDAFSIHPDNNVLSSKFLYYALKKDQTKIHNMSKGAGVPHVRAKEFESYKVPVPPLEEQARIVALLDKFDTLTNSISEGLPREIALRQKQYEYYRDLLLSFPKTKEEQ